MYRIQCGRRTIVIEKGKPLVMGILNVTPDSFSDSGVPPDEKIERLLAGRPDLIDIGGESTRPGAAAISCGEELRRILPALRRIRKIFPDIPVSIDTRKSGVAAAALDEGADIVNDVSCLRFDPGLADVVSSRSAGLILNHSRGTPESMTDPGYLEYPGGVVETVRDELKSAVDFAVSRGVGKDSIILDPGFGFAKTTEQNLLLLRNPGPLLDLGFPLLSGPSRKRFIGDLTGESDPAGRDCGTCGAVIASMLSGYAIIRVHNVKAARDCLAVFSGIFPCP